MNKQKMRFYMLLITYTVLLAAVLIKLDDIFGVISQLALLLAPVFGGGAVAFVLKRPYDALFCRLKKLLPKKAEGLAPAISLLSVYILLFGFLAVIISIVVPQLANSVGMLKTAIETMSPSFMQWAQSAQQMLAGWGISVADYEEFFRKLPDMVGQFLLEAMPQLFSVTNSVLKSVTNIVLGLVFSIYLLLYRKTLAEQSKRVMRAYLSEGRYQRLLHIASVCNDTFTRFIGGQLTEAFILGGLCFVGMLLLGLEYAMLISVMIGLTSLVPIVGAFVGAAPSAFILLMISPKKALVFLVFLVVLQQFEGNVIYPRVVGGSLGLPALWIMVAITVGGGMFGIVGMLLAVPITSVIYQLVGESVAARLSQKAAAEGEK